MWSQILNFSFEIVACNTHCLLNHNPPWKIKQLIELINHVIKNRKIETNKYKTNK